MVPRRENVENSTAGEGVAVPDGLHPGDGPPSLQEHVRLKPQAQLRSLLDLGVPLQRQNEGTHKVPCLLHAATPQYPNHPGERGKDFNDPPAGDPKIQGVGIK